MTVEIASNQISDKEKGTAIVDSEDKLVRADKLIEELQIDKSGALNKIIHLARRLQTKISRRVLLKNNDINFDLWVDAYPKEDGSVLIEVEHYRQEEALSEKEQDISQDPSSFQEAGEKIESSVLPENEDPGIGNWKWQVDAELNLTSFPTALADQIGIDSQIYLKKPFARLFKLETDEEGRFPIMEALANHHDFSAQPAKITNKGPAIWLSGRPIFDVSERFKGFSGNITLASSALEEDLLVETTAQNKIKLHLPNRIDHSFKPSIHRIIEDADKIYSQNDGYLHSSYVRYAADITTASQHLMMLIDDLGDLQELENTGFRVEPQPVDLSEIAKQAIALHSWKIQNQDIKIDIPKSGESVVAYADAHRVMQILLNLISNALRYSPEQASIWIRVEQDEDKAYITIADQGKGIAAEDQRRIFEKFERLNPQDSNGAGLGLFISRELAHAMQGDIVVDSALGQGARFTLILPLL